MSLKAFHIVFIAISICMTLGFAVWLFQSYTNSGGAGYLVAAVVAVLTGAGLAVYARRFLKKLKHVSYL